MSREDWMNRRLYPIEMVTETGLTGREVWRMETGPGRVIVLETMEEVLFETRTPPYRDRSETLPVLRVVCESNVMVQVGPLLRRTLLIEGLNDQGVVLEKCELTMDDTEVFGGTFGQSVGHRFDSSVRRIKLVGWRVEPKP